MRYTKEIDGYLEYADVDYSGDEFSIVFTHAYSDIYDLYTFLDTHDTFSFGGRYYKKVSHSYSVKDDVYDGTFYTITIQLEKEK